MMNRDIAAGECTGNKKLRRRRSTLQAVGVSVDTVRCRALSLLHQPLLRHPLAHIIPHVDFQYAPLGGEVASRHIPLRPAFRRRLRQGAAVIGQRGAQVMTTHHQYLLQLIIGLRRQRGQWQRYQQGQGKH